MIYLPLDFLLPLYIFVHLESSFLPVKESFFCGLFSWHHVFVSLLPLLSLTVVWVNSWSWARLRGLTTLNLWRRICDLPFGPVYLDVPLALHGMILKFPSLTSLTSCLCSLFLIPQVKTLQCLWILSLCPTSLPSSTLCAVANAHELSQGFSDRSSRLCSPGAGPYFLSCRQLLNSYSCCPCLQSVLLWSVLYMLQLHISSQSIVSYKKSVPKALLFHCWWQLTELYT